MDKGIKTNYGYDVSNTNMEILYSEYLNMKLRLKEWLATHNNTDPARVYLAEATNVRYKLSPSRGYVNIVRFEDIDSRVETYPNSHQQKNCQFVYVVRPGITPVPKPPINSEWVVTGLFTQDYQKTAYTCADASMSMMLSAKGYTDTEQYLATISGTTKNGTPHSGIHKAISKVAPKIQQSELSFNSVSAKDIAIVLKVGCEFILHVQTEGLQTDAYGKRVWYNNYGHYIFLTGVNVNKDLIRVFDPTKGSCDFLWSQMAKATSLVVGQKSLLKFC